MIKTDDLYLENLKEFVYDDKKVVTYKFLSVFLGVHVNLAKQMLYTFIEKEKKAGKKVHSLLYVSGATSKTLWSQDSNGGTPEEDPLEWHGVVLCKDTDLEEVKAKFSKLFSVHVYCVSSFPIQDRATLQAVVSEKVEDKDGRTPADYGPFSCSTDLRPNKERAVTVNVTPTPKVKEEVQSKPKESEPEKAKKTNAKTQGGSKNKHFFGTQSQKPGSKGPGQSSIENSMGKMKASVKPDKSNVEPAKSDEKTKAVNTRRKRDSKSSSKSRKRIRMASDSDSDDNHANEKDILSSSEEDDTDTDDSSKSPQPKHKSRIISSDSEEDFQQNLTVPQEDAAAEKRSGTGRKRVTKVIDKRFVDDEGYLVTRKETVVVSESDNDIDMEVENNSKRDEDTSQSKSNKPAVEVKPARSQDSKPTEKNSQATKSSGVTNGKSSAVSSQSKSKTKQASIMNFFSKK